LRNSNDEKHDDVAGPGHGFVDVFNFQGHMVKRFASGGVLNSPWGLAKRLRTLASSARTSWWEIPATVELMRFDPTTGDFVGSPRDVNNKMISIDGLLGAYIWQRRLNRAPQRPFLYRGSR